MKSSVSTIRDILLSKLLAICLPVASSSVASFFIECYRLSDSQIEDLNRGESFSNSSLRRKLFNNDSDCSMSDNSPERLTPSRPSNQESPTMVCIMDVGNLMVEVECHNISQNWNVSIGTLY